jgi:hypothetical protein
MKLMNKTTLLFAVMLALALAGCGPKPADLVGTWQGEFELPEQADSDDPGAAVAQEMMMEAMSDSLSLELNEDMTFEMNMVFPISGTWELDGDRVVLEADSFMGLNTEDFNGDEGDATEEPLILEVTEGGDRLELVLEDGDEQEGELYFTRN